MSCRTNQVIDWFYDWSQLGNLGWLNLPHSPILTPPVTANICLANYNNHYSQMVQEIEFPSMQALWTRPLLLLYPYIPHVPKMRNTVIHTPSCAAHVDYFSTSQMGVAVHRLRLSDWWLAGISADTSLVITQVMSLKKTRKCGSYA